MIHLSSGDDARDQPDAHGRRDQQLDAKATQQWRRLG
jgi:hypothetical protein